MAGMLLHMDGSKHGWFQDERWYDLLVILDDASSGIYYAQLVEEESTRTVMAALREVIERNGLFCALYSDRGRHFFLTAKAGEPVDKFRLTQVDRRRLRRVQVTATGWRVSWALSYQKIDCGRVRNPTSLKVQPGAPRSVRHQRQMKAV